MQSLLLTIANDKSADEDLTKAFNKLKMKAKTIDSIETPLFAKTLHDYSQKWDMLTLAPQIKNFRSYWGYLDLNIPKSGFSSQIGHF